MEYIIISLKHSEPEQLAFWGPNDTGYTSNPFAAGRYTEDQIKAQPAYYNDGHNSIAVPTSSPAIAKLLGLSIKPKLAAIESYHKNKQNLLR